MNAQKKLERIIRGERVICSDKEYDEIIDIFNKNDELYELHGQYLVSIFNPGRCGILDSLVAYLNWFPQ